MQQLADDKEVAIEQKAPLEVMEDLYWYAAGRPGAGGVLECPCSWVGACRVQVLGISCWVARPRIMPSMRVGR